jgi:hypothetical protein
MTWFNPDIWKAVAAYTYLTICLFDFVIAPVISNVRYPSQNERIKMVAAIPIESRGQSAQFYADFIMEHAPGREPLTLRSGGMFHLAFGAILTGAAIAGRSTHA